MTEHMIVKLARLIFTNNVIVANKILDQATE